MRAYLAFDDIASRNHVPEEEDHFAWIVKSGSGVVCGDVDCFQAKNSNRSRDSMFHLNTKQGTAYHLTCYSSNCDNPMGSDGQERGDKVIVNTVSDLFCFRITVSQRVTETDIGEETSYGS